MYGKAQVDLLYSCMSEAEFYRIERYLLNELSAEEETAFEKEMAARKELRLAVKEYQELLLGIRDAGRSELMKSLEQGGQKTRHITFDFGVAWKIAAAILMVVGVGYYTIDFIITRNNNEAIYETYYEPIPDLEIKLSPDSAAANSVKKNALAEYQAGHYQKSLELLDEENQNDSDIPMLRGLSYLEQDNPKTAAIEFRKVLSLKDRHQTESKWLLSLCLVKTNNKKEAIALLKSLSSSSNMEYKTKSSQLLRELTGNDSKVEPKDNSEQKSSQALPEELKAAQDAFTKKNYEEAFERYMKLAKAGNIRAMKQVAFMYERGFGTAPNVKESLRWYLRVQPKYYVGNTEIKRKLSEFEAAGIKLDTLIDQPDSLLNRISTKLP